MTSTTRHEILSLIKRHGPLTVQELSRRLGITPMGVRQHLAILERDGQLRPNGIRRGQGRPSRVYGITPEGDKVFPRTYEEIATSLLKDLRALDGDAKVDALFECRRTRQLEQYRTRITGKDLPDRVAILAKIRDEEGYLAESEELGTDTFALTEYNCPIRVIAEAHRQACGSEMALFTEVLGAEVARTEHLVAGAPRCRYIITRSRDRGAKP
ncbi:MAG TPA: metalloregulator ArsR/SmtB family transcription factor [bacterium]|nr:metalloregulator ArsR/SmtB family transcription factor [bacterium]